VREPPPGAPEQTIDLDRAHAARLGISRAELASTLRAALDGDPIGALRSGAHERDLVLRVHGSVAERLARARMRAPGGALVPLSAVAAARTSWSEHLLRLDREPAIELSAYVAPGRSPAAARRRLAELARDLPPGYRAIVRP
jgi:multidrug efflux pump subunit AcrB